jgi:hypothetical protein
MMVSNVDDLDRFYRALFEGDLVSEESLRAMTGTEYVGSDYQAMDSGSSTFSSQP